MHDPALKWISRNYSIGSVLKGFHYFQRFMALQERECQRSFRPWSCFPYLTTSSLSYKEGCHGGRGWSIAQRRDIWNKPLHIMAEKIPCSCGPPHEVTESRCGPILPAEPSVNSKGQVTQRELKGRHLGLPSYPITEVLQVWPTDPLKPWGPFRGSVRWKLFSQ